MMLVDTHNADSWAEAHRAMLTDLLDAAKRVKVAAHMWRSCYRDGGELVVATIVRTGTPASLKVYVTRPYHYSPNATAQLQLSGRYSVDEIIAFLRLDTIDPDSVDWQDETDYSGLVIADALGKVAE